jgi:hypothetical protein
VNWPFREFSHPFGGSSIRPRLERVRELVRACGLDLSFRLARVDETGHDAVVIERELRCSPAERLQRALDAGRAARSLRNVAAKMRLIRSRSFAFSRSTASARSSSAGRPRVSPAHPS